MSAQQKNYSKKATTEKKEPKKKQAELVQEYLESKNKSSSEKIFFRKHSFIFLVFSAVNLVGYFFYNNEYRPSQISATIWNERIPFVIFILLIYQIYVTIKTALYSVRTDDDGDGWRAILLWLIIITIFSGSYFGWKAVETLMNFI